MSPTPTCANWPRSKSNVWSPTITQMEEDLKILLLPKDPLDDKDVVLEIRAGTGGDEASLFAAEVFRMYTRYAETQRWKVEVTSEQRIGGRRPEGSSRARQRQQGLQQAEVRKRRAPRAARPGDRAAGPRPHFRHHRRRAARSRRSRSQGRRERHPHRYVLLVRPRRPVGQYHLLGRAHHAPAHRPDRLLPGRKIADQESRQSHARSALAPL